jgi:hypothetical protein
MSAAGIAIVLIALALFLALLVIVGLAFRLSGMQHEVDIAVRDLTRERSLGSFIGRMEAHEGQREKKLRERDAIDVGYVSALREIEESSRRTLDVCRTVLDDLLRMQGRTTTPAEEPTRPTLLPGAPDPAHESAPSTRSERPPPPASRAQPVRFEEQSEGIGRREHVVAAADRATRLDS